MYGAIKGRFNLDFGFPLCFDLDWFAERECWLQPGRQCSNGGNTVQYTLYSVHYALPHHYKGAKKSWGATRGYRGGAWNNEKGRGCDSRGQTRAMAENWVINVWSSREKAPAPRGLKQMNRHPEAGARMMILSAGSCPGRVRLMLTDQSSRKLAGEISCWAEKPPWKFHCQGQHHHPFFFVVRLILLCLLSVMSCL